MNNFFLLILIWKRIKSFFKLFFLNNEELKRFFIKQKFLQLPNNNLAVDLNNIHVCKIYERALGRIIKLELNFFCVKLKAFYSKYECRVMNNQEVN